VVLVIAKEQSLSAMMVLLAHLRKFVDNRVRLIWDLILERVLRLHQVLG